ncbi:MAG: alanine--tRNA ligase-related protein [Bacteroidales bacterium]
MKRWGMSIPPYDVRCFGNWSFGDYFKKEAIEWAWEFLTGVVNPPRRGYMPRFLKVIRRWNPGDDEAAGYWKKCLRIAMAGYLKGQKKDNFWESGDTGPCGPCSEIHIDLRSGKGEEAGAGRPACKQGASAGY